LGIGQTAVTISGFIAGIARRLSGCDAAEKRLERFVYTAQDILQDLRVYGLSALISRTCAACWE
jgi:hypothetical protein